MAVFKAKYLPDIIQTVVESIQTIPEGETIATPIFDYGYWQELANKLVVKGINWANNVKYPLIYLPVNYEIDLDDDAIYYGDAKFTLYIIAESGRNKSSQDRFSDVFKATLYPIMDNLINAIMNSSSFDKQGKRFISPVQNDLYYYDAEIGENKLNQAVDAIRLDFTDLKLTFTSECES